MYYYLITLAVIALDQLTKWIVVQNMEIGQKIEVIIVSYTGQATVMTGRLGVFWKDICGFSILLLLLLLEL